MLKDKIKEIRKAKGLTLEQLAEITGYSKGYLSLLENNKGKKPSWEVVEKIGIALGVCPKKLIVMWCSHIPSCVECSFK